MKTFKLDGEIAWFDYDDPEWGKFIGPKSVQAWLKTLKDGEKAEIEINSPGGDVISGIAIANSIKNSRAHVRAHVIGVAASMASVIACACHEVVMEESSFMMVHNPWAATEGNAEQLRKTADTLDKMRDSLITFYRSKFGGTDDQLVELINAESWMTGREAQAGGFMVEVVASNVRIAAAATQKAWENAPEEARKFMKVKALPPELAEKFANALDEAGETGTTETETAQTETTETAQEAAENETTGTTETQRPQETGTDAADGEIETLRKSAAEWEARYKGASKAINERDRLKAKLVENEAELAALKERIEAANREKDNFKDQLDAARRDLESVKTDCSVAADRADNAERDLAQARERLGRMENAHRLLTGGVLSPDSYDDIEANKQRELENAKDAEEREAIRAKYAQLKNK